jgi:multicomponent Na+:H+ antiporter subunit D
LPPFSGFFGKVLILGEAVRVGGVSNWVLTAIGLVTGVLTLVVMAKVWSLAFWSPSRSVRPSSEFPSARLIAAQTRPGYLAVGLLVAASLAMGLGAGPAMRITGGATAGLSVPTQYVNAVFQRTVFPPEAVAQLRAAEAHRAEAEESATERLHEEVHR